jgi:hypothetical protein
MQKVNGSAYDVMASGHPTSTPVLDVTTPSVIAYHVILLPLPILLQGSRLENSQFDLVLIRLSTRVEVTLPADGECGI